MDSEVRYRNSGHARPTLCHDKPHRPTTAGQHSMRDAPVAQAIRDGGRKYTDLEVPILAIFADPHDPANYFPQVSQDKLAALSALDHTRTAAQVKAFEKLKSAKVVVLPNANHYVFSSNEQNVERTMKDFLNTPDELKSQ
jgi:non-heme chloroperoxidase